MTLFKMGFQKPYPEMLDDKIDQLNEHERQARIKMTELQRQYSEDVVKRKIRFMKIVSVLGFVCLIPVIISIETKRRLQMEIMQAIRQK